MKTQQAPRTLVPGNDYSTLFAMPAGCKMIFVSGTTWRGVKPDGTTMDLDSPAQTAKATELLNRKGYRCGT